MRSRLGLLVARSRSLSCIHCRFLGRRFCVIRIHNWLLGEAHFGVRCSRFFFFILGRLLHSPGLYLFRFFAGFCLIANGLYLFVDSFGRGGDGGTLIRSGASQWELVLFGAVTIPFGFWLWHKGVSPSIYRKPGLA